MNLKVGIIGLGVGEKHLAAYKAHPECEVVALCDFSEEKMAMSREKYPGIMFTNEADRLLENPDINLISIASYDNYHYDQCVKAIENGKHIFVEKPLCLYTEEAVHLRQLLKENTDLKMSSNLVLRTIPRFRKLKKMVQNGELGELFYVEGDYNYGRLHKITEGWRGKLDFYSVFYGGGVHIIDLLLWLTGDRIIEVSACGNQIASRSSGFQYNDMVVSLLKFQSGMIGKVSSNFGCVLPHFHSLQIYGTNATFINSKEHGRLVDSREHNEPEKQITEVYPGADQGTVISSFVNSILGRTEPMVTAENIFEVMSVCFAIEKASHQSRSVMVEYI